MDITISTKDAIFLILYDTQVYHHKTFSFLKLETMRKALDEIHGIKRCIRTISRHLKNMQDTGYIKSFPPSYRRNPDGTVYAHPPNRSTTKRGLRWLEKKGVTVCRWLLDHLTGKKLLPRAKPVIRCERKPLEDNLKIRGPGGGPVHIGNVLSNLL